MGISELRNLDQRRSPLNAPHGTLAQDLVQSGVISKADLQLAQVVQNHCDARIGDILLAEGLVGPADILAAQARRFKSRCLSRESLLSLERFKVRIPAEVLLRHAVLPVRDRDGNPALICSEPDDLILLWPRLPKILRDARILFAPRQLVQECISIHHREYLTNLAQSRVAEHESCRTWAKKSGRRIVGTSVLFAVLLSCAVLYPTVTFSIFAGWAVFTLLISALFKAAAFIAGELGSGDSPPVDDKEESEPLPKVSILVPLFRETEIAHALIARLSGLTYPKCLLDVILVLEEEDKLTQETLASIDLPSWIRPVIVPDGQPRTKPRAMNYALDYCEGDLVGIFDAEDAPDPDQITRVACRFQQVKDDVVCLQGILDYYNPRQNWIARCFTIEYAAWFRRMLPGMARLGFAIPLGGTTLYFRRDVLEELGGWDAHNVTEDADLGFRLARHGYRAQLIETVTNEEANCRPWAWVKQRSRWLKGYVTTYLVHMRSPRLLFKQLGAWKFLGFQAHFLAALSQFLLAPVLWSFWLILLGVPHPLSSVVPNDFLVMLGVSFLAIELVNIAIFALAVRGQKHRHLVPWAPTMHFYTPFAAIAAYKALYEVVFKPFYWEKTTHGLSLNQKQRQGQSSQESVSDNAVDLA